MEKDSKKKKSILRNISSHLTALFLILFIILISACAPSLDSQRMAMKNTMSAYMNTPYRYAGAAKSGIDCSAFTQKVYSSAGISLPRTASEQFSEGKEVKGDDYLFGDLLFFDTSIKDSNCCCFFFPFSLLFGHSKPKNPTHVGIYTSGGKFTHASASSGVTTDSINSSYWEKRFLGARRLLRE